MSAHPTSEEFEAFLTNASRPGDAASNGRIVRHLLAGCGICRQQLDQMGWDQVRLGRLLSLRATEASAAAEAYDYSPAFAAAQSSLASFFSRGTAPKPPVEALWSELAALSAEEQLQLVGEDRRFASPELIQQWIEGSRAFRFDDPEKNLHLAHLSCLASERCQVEDTGSPERLADLRSQSWRQYANALRVQGRLREAEAGFARALRYCHEGTGDPPVRAKLFAQMVSLRIFQRRFDEAVRLAEDAGRIYKEIGQINAFASTLVQKAVASLYAGDPEESVRTLNRAIPLIDPSGDPHLLLAACHNLIRCYIDLEQPEQALSLYFDARELYREFQDSLILLRSGWQEGQLLRDLGHFQAAEVSLVQARAGFAGQELQYEAALVSLDLASVYVKLGDPEKLREIVLTTVPIFQSLGVDREALASLLQLQQLSQQGRQAFELIRRLSSKVEQLGRGAA